MKTYYKALLFFISIFFVSSVFSQKIATSGPIQKIKLNEKGIYHSFVNVFGNSIICSETIDMQIRIMPQFQKKNTKTRKYLKYFKKTLLATVQHKAGQLSKNCPDLKRFNIFVWKPKYNDHELATKFYQVNKSDSWNKLIERNSYHTLESPDYSFDFISSNRFDHRFTNQHSIFAKGKYHLDGENFTAVYGKFSHQNVGGFIPYTGGGGYMQGKLGPIVSDGLLTYISVSGEWYEDAYIFSDHRGNRGYKACRATIKQGRALWGTFTLTINIEDNSMPKIKWFTCKGNISESLNIRASGANNLQASIFAAAPQEKYQQYVEDQKKIALTTLDPIKLGSIKSDKNIVLDLEYTGACAERVGLIVKDKFINTGEVWGNVYESPAQVAVNYAKEKILARCKKVKYIDIISKARKGSVKRLSAARKNNWEVRTASRNLVGQSSMHGTEGKYEKIHISSDGKLFKGNYGKGEWGLSLWSKLDGKVVHQIVNNKIESVKISGNWYEHGSQNKQCDTNLNGYAYWGSFAFSIKKNGEVSRAKRYFCSTTANEKSQDWWMLKGRYSNGLNQGILDNTEVKEFLQYSIKMEEAQLALSLKKVQKANSSEKIKKESPFYLAKLGYFSSGFLFSVNNIDFFEAKSREKQTYYSIIAIHNIKDNESLFHKPIVQSVDSYRRGFRLSNKDEKFYSNEVLPRLEKLLKKPKKSISIYHYTKNMNIADISKKPTPGAVSPLISTRFNKGSPSSGWSQHFAYYTKRKLLRMSDKNGFSYNEVYALRKDQKNKEKEELRLTMLSPQERAMEEINQLKIENQKLKADGRRKGYVTRDWMYWEQYAYGEDYESIFNGVHNSNQRTAIFPHLLLRFYAEFYRSCKENIPSNSPGYNYYTDTTVSNGYFSSEYRRFDGKIQVKQRYWDEFKKHHSNPPDLGLIGSIGDTLNAIKNKSDAQINRSIKDAKNYAKRFQSFNSDSALLIKNEGCNSGFIKQMEENFYRASLKVSSIQKDKGKLTYSQQDSGGKFSKSELFASCVVYRGPRKNKEWCNCIDNSFAGVLNQEEKRKYTKDFSLLVSEANANIRNWRLFTPYSKCYK